MALPSKRALLGSIIDYAGTFPPAALSLANALKEAATHSKDLKHPWLYNRMALPLKDLSTLTTQQFWDSGATGDPWLFTALGSTGHDDFRVQVQWDFKELERFNKRGVDSSLRHMIVSYETKMPNGTSAGDAAKILTERTLRVSRLRPDLYLEVPCGDGKELMRTGEEIAKSLENAEEQAVTFGAKVRTGGEKTPSADALAHFLIMCQTFRFRFKATQGLHDVVSHGDQYGFVNLFAALSFLFALGRDAFPLAKVRECLTDQDSKNFAFEADRFKWKNESLSIDQIESARREHAGCFGSCSIQEPDESLGKVFK